MEKQENRIVISTLAPREGSDGFKKPEIAKALGFQPSLPARGATYIYRGDVFLVLFQPSLPARGATGAGGYNGLAGRDFNPRSPRGERHDENGLIDSYRVISTLAPREGSDRKSGRIKGRAWDFNPRSPRGERLVLR